MPAPQRGHSIPQSQLPQGSSRSPRQITPAHAPATQVGSDSRIKLQFDSLTYRLRVQHLSIEGIPLRSAANTLEEGGNVSVFHTETIGAFFTAVSGENISERWLALQAVGVARRAGHPSGPDRPLLNRTG